MPANNQFILEEEPEAPPKMTKADQVHRLRAWIFCAFEGPIFDLHGSPAVFVAVTLLAMITLSLLCFVLETMPRFQGEDWDVIWRAVEISTTVLFTIEYLLRLWVADVMGVSAITWMLRATNACDLLAILPLYIDLAFGGQKGVQDTIKVLRVLRMARLFKLGRYFRGVQVMTTAVVNSLSALKILVFLFFMGVVFFGSAVYVTEKYACPTFDCKDGLDLADFLVYNEECLHPDNVAGTSTYGACCKYWCDGMIADNTTFQLCAYRASMSSFATGQMDSDALWEAHAMHEVDFASIPEAMWWASVTMTTVGYGDLIPKYWLSKLVSSAAMLSGMLIIAMPFAIVGARFGEAVKAYEAHEEEFEHKVKWHYTKHLQRRLSGLSFLAPSRSITEVGALSHSNTFQARSGSSASVATSTAGHRVSQEQLLKLQGAVKESVELKQKIAELQVLRNNLWTSAEHAMAVLVYEGIISLDKDAAPKKEDRGGVQDADRFCEWSCFVLHRDSRLRRLAIWLTQDWFWFDQFIILAIISNSIVLALEDYYQDLYDPPHKPWENKLGERTEAFFIILFTAEFALKVMAQGFVLDHGSYLQEAWNWLDFVVVVTGIVTLFSAGGSDVSFLRTVRVLRPLRTLSAMPGMRSLVNTVFLSLPRLKDVTLMALFLLVTFGVLGLHFWGGVLHRLCRITPQPLHFTQRALEPSCAGWCFDNQSDVNIVLSNGDVATLQSALVFEAFCSTSPECTRFFTNGWDYFIWPIDETQDRFCGNRDCDPLPIASLPSSGVASTVLASQVLGQMGLGATEKSLPTTCGSPLSSDELYGPEAANSELAGVLLTHWDDEVHKDAFNWGISNYDQLGSAFLLIFQCVTLEGWVDIMYMLQDADSTLLTFVYFLGLVMIGAFFLVNVIIAIVMDAFQHVLDLREAEQEASQERARTAKSGFDSITTEHTLSDALEKKTSSAVGSLSVADLLRRSAEHLLRFGLMTKSGNGRSREDDFDHMHSVATTSSPRSANGLRQDHPEPTVRRDRTLMELAKDIHRQPRTGPMAWYLRTRAHLRQFSEDSKDYFVRRIALRISSHWLWNSFIMLVIALNVVVLSLDNYRDPVLAKKLSDLLNTVFNIIFYLEFIVLHVALGPHKYWSDAALRFDGIIVLLSVFDFFGGSFFSSLRAFRLLRIFKLAKRVPSMRVLMKAIVETLLQMRDFVLLLCLVIIVFALVGQSFFGGQMMFDPNTGLLVPEAERKARCAPPPFEPGDIRPVCVPRAHFDSFLWACMTVFQILTGENWNEVMYNGMRAVGWPYLFFFVVVIVFGNFVILNLFLAMLMSNFEESRARLKSQENPEEEEDQQRVLKTQEEIIAALGKGSTLAFLDMNKRQQGDQSQALSDGTSGAGSRCLGADKEDELPDRLEAAPGEILEEASAPLTMAWTPETNHAPPIAHEKMQPKSVVALSDMKDLKVESASDSSQDKRDKESGNHSTVPMARLNPDMIQSSREMMTTSRSVPVNLIKLPGCVEHSSEKGNTPATMSKTCSHMAHEEEKLVQRDSQRLSTAGGLQFMVSARRHTAGALLGTAGRNSFLSWSRGGEEVGTGEDAQGELMQNRIRTISTRAVSGMNGIVSNLLGTDSRQVHPETSLGEAPSSASTRSSSRRVSVRVAQEGARRSMCVFSRRSCIRKWCLNCVTHKRFDQLIMLLIIISSVLMIFQNPLRDPDGWQTVTLLWANVGFTTVFTVEMVMKVIAFGLCCARSTNYPAYLRSSWNLLDGAIVSISVIDVTQTLITSGEERSGIFATFQIFRLARVLRPLRLISRNESLKVVVRTIGDSLPELRNLLLFSSSFFLIFGLLGVTEYKGSFYSCVDSSLEDFTFTPQFPTTPLCVPNVPIDPAASTWEALRFVSHRSDAACPSTSSFEWMRPTRDTPICEVRCDAGPAPFCDASTPWGYHIMRCSDCQQTFCPDAFSDSEQVQTCRDFCSDHQLFCENNKGNEECNLECMSECLCGPESHKHYCYGLVRDAAVCVEQGGRWVNKNQHFNHVGNGILSLFEIATTEGWVDVMYSAVDSNGEMMQPVRDKNTIVGSATFVAFMFIGCFFVLNLCVGVIIDNYCKQKADKGHYLMTEGQYNLAIIRWVEWQKVVYGRKTFFIQTNLASLPPTRRHLVTIVSSATFENIIMACILLNTLVLGMQWHPEPRPPHAPRNYSNLLNTVNLLLSLVFNMEALMKLAAFHLNYFKDRWNIFDFVCVLASDAFLILQAVWSTSDSATQNVDMSALVTAFRIFRIARLFRLLRFLKGLNQLFRAFILSVPKLLNVFFIMCLLIYVYAVLGLNLFAKAHYMGTYGPTANFRSFFGAISLLIRSMTGEAWNEIMHDLAKDRFFFESYLDTHCVEDLQVSSNNFQSLDLDGDGLVDDDKIIQCGTWASYIYFVTYTVSVTFVILNLFIAVIFEGFDESQKSELTDIVEKAVQLWKKYDPDFKMHIPAEQAMDFIDEAVEALCRGADQQADVAPHCGPTVPWYQGEPRWEMQYRSASKRVGDPWPYFNLLYIRVLELETVHNQQVSFKMALRGLIRRIICQGGLSDPHLPPEEAKKKRRETLRQLEVFEDEMNQRSASKDPRRVPHSPIRLMMKRRGPLFLTSSIGSENWRLSDNDKEDHSLTKLVAATKIQRRYKERMLMRLTGDSAQFIGRRSSRSSAAALT